LENKAKAKIKLVSKASNGQSYDILILRRVLAHKNSHFSPSPRHFSIRPENARFRDAEICSTKAENNADNCHFRASAQLPAAFLILS
jgi:hypothetical protein